jgi:putative sigma-54 modulation protein
MRITVKGKNVEVTDALQNYAEKKVEKLSKYFQTLRAATVTESVQRNWQIVEITLEGDGILLRSEERSDNMYASVDLAVEKLETQIRRFKGKLMERTHPGISPKEQVSAPEAVEAAVEIPRIVRTKNVTLKPMQAEEAAMQMELVNHNFYIFQNSDNDLVSVIYKREDGNYGLIEPEV